MVWSIYYYDIVRSDIKEAKDWYKRQKPGLEKEFSKEIKKSILRLKSNPLGYEIKYKTSEPLLLTSSLMQFISTWMNCSLFSDNRYCAPKPPPLITR